MIQRWCERFYWPAAAGLVLLALVYHVWSLPYTPVVWSDEVCYNSITVNWLKHGTFFFEADWRWADGRESLVYGPVFFWLNGLVLSLFGNGVFQGRFVVMLAGIGIFAWAAHAFRYRLKLNAMLALVGLALFTTDPFFSGALNKARMDTLALLFYLLSVGIVLSFFDRPARKTQTAWWTAAGVFYGLSVITTFRILLLVPPVAVLLLWLWWNERFSIKMLGRMILLGVTPLFFLVGWLAIAFGTVQECVEYMTWVNSKLQTQNPIRWRPLPEAYPLYFVSLSAIGLGILIFKRAFFTPLHVFFLVYIVTYNRLVLDTGPYVMLLIPVLYMTALSTAQLLHERKFWGLFSKVALVLLLLFNVGYRVHFTAALARDATNRRPSDVDAFIAHIPSGARVCADWVYYYSVLRNGNSLQLMFSFQMTNDGMAAYSLDTFDLDYLVVSKRIDSLRHRLVQDYLAKAQYEPVAVLGVFDDYALNNLRVLSPRGYETGPYDGVIYRRIR